MNVFPWSTCRFERTSVKNRFYIHFLLLFMGVVGCVGVLESCCVKYPDNWSPWAPCRPLCTPLQRRYTPGTCDICSDIENRKPMYCSARYHAFVYKVWSIWQFIYINLVCSPNDPGRTKSSVYKCFLAGMGCLVEGRGGHAVCGTLLRLYGYFLARMGIIDMSIVCFFKKVTCIITILLCLVV